MDEDSKKPDEIVNFEAKRSKILQYIAYGSDESDGEEEGSSSEEFQELIMPLSIKPSDLIMNKPVGFVSSASSRVKIGINSRLSSRMTSCCPSQHNLACESDISFCSANTAPLPYRKDLFWDMGMLQSRLSSTATLNKWVAHNSQRRRIAESFHRDIPRLARLISNTKVNITKSIDGKPEVIHSSTALARLNELCPVENEETIVVNNDGFFTPPCTSMTFIGSDNGQLDLSLNPMLTPDIFNALRNQVIILDGMVKSNRNQLAIGAPVNHHVAEHQYIAEEAVSNDICLKSNAVAKLEDITLEIDENHQLFPAISHSETTTSLNSAEPSKETQSEEKVVEIAQHVVQGAIKSAVKIINSVPALNDTQCEKNLVEAAQVIVQDISAHNIITSEAQTGGVKDDVAKATNQDAVSVKPKGEYVACKVKPVVAPKPSKKARAKKMIPCPSPKVVGGGKMLGKKVACGDVTQKFWQHNNVHVVQSAFIDDCPIRQGSTRRKIQHFENMTIFFKRNQGKAKTNGKSYGMRQNSSIPLNKSDVTLNDEQHNSPDVEKNNLTRLVDVSTEPEQQKNVGVEENTSGIFHDAISDIYSIQEIQWSGSREAVANHEIVDGVEAPKSHNNTKAYDDVGEVKNSIFIRDIDPIQKLQWSDRSGAVANHGVVDGVESPISHNNTKAYDDVGEVKNSIFIRDTSNIQELQRSGSSEGVANHEVADGVESLEPDNAKLGLCDEVEVIKDSISSIFNSDTNSIQELQRSGSSDVVANHEVVDGVKSLKSDNVELHELEEVKDNISDSDIDSTQDELQLSGSEAAVKNHEVAEGAEVRESDKIPNDTNAANVIKHDKKSTNETIERPEIMVESNTQSAVSSRRVGFFHRLLRRFRHRIIRKRRRRTSTPTGADEHQDATANDNADNDVRKNEANDDDTSKDYDYDRNVAVVIL